MAQLFQFPRPTILVTAEILYRLPDYPDILQTYIWQDIDVTPDFPALHAFLNFWQRHLEGRLHSVEVATTIGRRALDWQHCHEEYKMH